MGGSPGGGPSSHPHTELSLCPSPNPPGFIAWAPVSPVLCFKSDSAKVHNSTPTELTPEGEAAALTFPSSDNNRARSSRRGGVGGGSLGEARGRGQGSVSGEPQPCPGAFAPWVAARRPRSLQLPGPARSSLPPRRCAGLRGVLLSCGGREPAALRHQMRGGRGRRPGLSPGPVPSAEERTHVPVSPG